MKRRFRQKEDQSPKNDPPTDDGLTEDSLVKNIDIDNVINEIDKHLRNEKRNRNKPQKKSKVILVLFNALIAL
ncbi:MAG TPA: hypothetical protein VHO68_14265 [Bacteroidales bacterium]|nr:hypothetical protein [Bacteroidales bacterium]